MTAFYSEPEKALQVLEHARELFSDPAFWCHGYALGRMKDGHLVYVYSFQELPVAWSLDGGIGKAARDIFSPLHFVAQSEACAAVRDVIENRGFRSFIDFNGADSTTHADVLAVLDESIACMKDVVG